MTGIMNMITDLALDIWSLFQVCTLGGNGWEKLDIMR